MDYNLAIYDISIKEAMHLGVDEVAFVEDPAIQELFIAMANEQIKLAADNDKMIVTGPALVPDRLIYRVHPKTGMEYYIRFSKEVIQEIVLRYFTQNKQLNFNLEHNKENDVQGVILESWIVKDPTYDQSSLYGFKNLPIGTWMVSVKVEDKEFWNEYVKSGKVRGFSIEGSFGQSLAEAMSKQEELVEPKSGETKDEYIGRCIAYHINEGMTEEQGAAICYTKWEDTKLRVGEKVSFDYDGTINTRLGKALAKKEIQSGSTVYIISARDNASGMYRIADEIGIPHERVIATGSNLKKAEMIKKLGIDTHYDNNRMVRKLLPKGVGVNFTLSAQEAEILIKSILMSKYGYPVGDFLSGFSENEKQPCEYELECQKMVIRGVEYFDTHPELHELISGGGVTAFDEVVAPLIKFMCTDENGKENGATGAMVEHTTKHAYYAYKVGWDKYIKEMTSYELSHQLSKLKNISSPSLVELSLGEITLASYTDYPEAAKQNAQRALDWAEENGWGSCGTPVGKQRANQLAKGEPISEETIARMAAFERHRQNSTTPYGEGCGKLMWDAWGGDEGIAWAQRKLEQIRTV